MSDRRERVLDAIDAALHDDTPIVVIVARHAGEYDWDTLLDRVADAALAALDAIPPAAPTDAEITDIRLYLQDRAVFIDPLDIRAVLFAARKVGQGSQP